MKLAYAVEVEQLEAIIATARENLRGLPRETLGLWRTPRKVLGMGGEAKLVSVGTAWHVGSLLISDEFIAAVGEVTRAADPGRRGYAAESARDRASVRLAALRGKNPPGTIVHFGWDKIDPRALARGEASGNLVPTPTGVAIRWSAAGMLQPLGPYLEERISLLREAGERA